jgi:molybdenum cofactor cytidylyltransferase
MQDRDVFAIIPAAGWSRRMGEPKLLLPLGEKTVIARLLETLDRPLIRCRAVVLRRNDESLLNEVKAAGAWAIRPAEDPPEMRQSVQFALSEIAEKFSPRESDGWLLVPADHPVLSRTVIDCLIANWQKTSAEILVPCREGHRGHPTIFSWRLAEQVPRIPAGLGLNWLVRSSGAVLQEVPMDDPAIFTDLDTPADYEALKKSFPAES